MEGDDHYGKVKEMQYTSQNLAESITDASIIAMTKI